MSVRSVLAAPFRAVARAAFTRMAVRHAQGVADLATGRTGAGEFPAEAVAWLGLAGTLAGAAANALAPAPAAPEPTAFESPEYQAWWAVQQAEAAADRAERQRAGAEQRAAWCARVLAALPATTPVTVEALRARVGRTQGLRR